MGANPTQALALLVFFVAFVLIAAGFFSGGSVIAFLAGLAVAGISATLFRKARPWENAEE